ncbi:flagellar biosynthesis regulator FlhF [Clostridium carboxidivorans P7]|uniref:Flagellar biosynthesis protein FlhF n=1 Tax=Clostridium carboxidivorans P7 TaxID=536227 RepID=C6PPD5_9CLOT|nr:flagellar biosynthesis protein FlhF [Clostridium carboxidivorans]AKN33965.1 flagellar biosynthesis regulator FlhF [Clostridium carboxidivorans P7]EET88829.1 GTP-binding signal recognition particle SRP54 G-domain protein [Clostridium carboxidivorans P7]EFG88159.1 flagellar biosynthesis protein FlhF [Clostridium carboxidivorans P7]
MVIKRYIVKSMNEALTRIRYELGKDAVIISQRRIRKGGFLGFFSKRVLEVTAAIDNKKPSRDISSGENVEESIQAIKKIMNTKIKENEKQIKESNMPLNNQQRKRTEVIFDENYKSMLEKNNEQLVNEVKEMRNMLDEMVKGSNITIGKSKVQLYLEKMDVEDKVVKYIMNEMKMIPDDVPNKEKIKKVMEQIILTKPMEENDIVVLVGPTGVGKTTTIAKLAGKMALLEGKKVGLITIDTYRIGAVEQLKTYADIMNIPFKVVLTIKEMEAAVESMSNCDVILVDTTGRSSKNTMQISELRAFIEKVNTDNVNLVMSCTTKNRDIGVILEGYKPLNYSNIIITKLDETSTYGSILNICEGSKKPISFVTTGQNVPDDIKFMTSKEITNLVLGEDSI